jgi:hypothetical protein
MSIRTYDYLENWMNDLGKHGWLFISMAGTGDYVTVVMGRAIQPEGPKVSYATDHR